MRLAKAPRQSGEQGEPAMSEWQPIETAPKDGSWVRVKHELGTYGTGQTVGKWSGDHWQCSEFFIDPHTMRMYRTPTHWAPKEEGDDE
jgi:hypothetical protein